MDQYLSATEFLDHNHPSVAAFAQQYGVGDTPLQQAVALYYQVRDSIAYSPYKITFKRDTYTAHYALAQSESFCIPKAILLASACRAIGIPARLGFADVTNHLSSAKLIAMLRTEVFAFHGYVELYLNERWVICTPAFDQALCEKMGVAPLEFDGVNDSALQEYNLKGGRYMEYLHYYGTFAEFPYMKMAEKICDYYPHIFKMALFEAV